MRIHMVLAPVAALALSISTVASADVITSAVAVQGPPPIDDFVWENTIDQSGLTINYVSGVTDFDTYIGMGPQHIRSNVPANYAASFSLPPLNIDYDMGVAMTLTQMALWNYPFGNSAGIRDFNVLTANNADFSDALFVGTFLALDDGDGDINNAQVFDLINSAARYVRLEVLTAGPNGTGISEIAFAVPGPGTALFFVMAVVVGRRRRR